MTDLFHTEKLSENLALREVFSYNGLLLGIQISSQAILGRVHEQEAHAVGTSNDADSRFGSDLGMGLLLTRQDLNRNGKCGQRILGFAHPGTEIEGHF